jgi:hypothetical protein
MEQSGAHQEEGKTGLSISTAVLPSGTFSAQTSPSVPVLTPVPSAGTDSALLCRDTLRKSYQSEAKYGVQAKRHPNTFTVDSRLSARGLTALRLNRGNVFVKKKFYFP